MAFIENGAMRTGEPLPGWRGRFFRSDSMSFAQYEVDRDSSIHEHHHPNEEVWIIVEGQLEVTVDGETRIVNAGDVAVVPGDVPHSVVALTDARAVVANHPIRTAFR